MSCKLGDSIRAGYIPSYTSLIERHDFDNSKPYELSYQDASEIYQEILYKMQSIGFNGAKLVCRVGESKVQKGTIRIIYKRSQEYDYIHPDVYNSRVGALVQNLLILHYGDLRYINFLIKKIRSNISNICKGYLKPYYSGICVQDISCQFYHDSIEIEKFLNENLNIINSQLETCIIDSINVNCTYNIMPSDMNLMIGLLDRDMFKDLADRYKEWSSSDQVRILEQDIRASIHLMLKEKNIPKSDIMFKITQHKDKWLIGCVLPSNISPYLIIKSMYPKIKLNEIYHHCQFVITGVYRSLHKISDSELISLSSDSCSCNKELVYDLVRRRVSRKCLDCLVKSFMGAYMRL